MNKSPNAFLHGRSAQIVERGEELQILLCVQSPKKAQFCVHNESHRFPSRRIVAERIVAVHDNFALGREEQTSNKLKQRSFAGTVWSKQGNPISFFNLQVYRLEGRHHATTLERVQ